MGVLMPHFFEGKVKLPGIGEVPKAAVWIGGAVVATAVVLYYRHQSAGGGAADQTDAFLPDGSIVDSPGGDGGGGGGGGGGDGPHEGPPFTTNALWDQYVTAYLTNIIGLKRATVSAALAPYLAGAAVTVAQKDIIQQAIAAGGTPPVAGLHGHPPAITVKGGHGGEGEKAKNPVDGLKVTPRSTQADVDWKSDPHATHYSVTVTQNRKTVHQETVHESKVTLHNLHKNTHYSVVVRAQPGKSGQRNAQHAFTTKH
jgi:hypothetical protein